MHAIVLALLIVACGRDTPAPPPAPKTQPAPPPAAGPPKPRVAFVFKQALSDTSLTDETVLARIQTQYLPDLRACYATELALHPDAEGKVIVKLAVTPAGGTTKVDVSGPAAACIQQAIAAWTFAPPTKDGAPVEAAFMLKLALTSTR